MAFFAKFRGGKSPKNAKTSVPAVEISEPCGLRHEVHVGMSDGILQGLPESWKSWLRAAKIRYHKTSNKCWGSLLEHGPRNRGI